MADRSSINPSERDNRSGATGNYPEQRVANDRGTAFLHRLKSNLDQTQEDKDRA
jgi:hypothetical protein